MTVAHTGEANTSNAVNIDPGEVAKFDRLAARWWDTAGEFKPLHEMNPVRCNYIDERAALAEKDVLDVGCGGGILCEAMARRGARVSGIDMAGAALEVAQLHTLESGLEIDYQQQSAEAFAAANPGRFAVVTCLELLEHVPDPASTIAACSRLTRPGGEVFFSTINRSPKAYALAVLGAEYLLKWLPKGTHEYRRFIRPAELARAGREAGLEIVDIKGIVYSPLLKQFRIDADDLGVNYIVHARKP